MVLGRQQKLLVVEQVIENLGYRLKKCLSSESEAINKVEQFDVILVTHDVSIAILEELKVVAERAKFILIEGGTASNDLVNELQKKFAFDLLLSRPISASLFSLQLQSILATDQIELEVIERKEFDFANNLKKGYLEVVEERVSTLTATLNAFLNDPSNIPIRAEAQRLAHNMGGTASSCGLAPLASLAFQLEQTIRKANVDRDIWLQITNSLLQEARNAKARSLTALKEQVASQSEDSWTKANSSMNCVAFVDDHFNQEICTMLADSSVNLILTYSAEEFKKASSTHPVDAVLIDLRCKSTDGIAIATSLRESEHLGEVPIGFIEDDGKLATEAAICAHIGGSIILRASDSAQSIVKACKQLVSMNRNGRPRILIVDDDEDFIDILAQTLSFNGMLVKACADPRLAEEFLQEFDAQLLIIDANMPQQSGIDLCRQIRSDPRWSDLPILFLTAEREISTRINAYEAGADDYLSKPLLVPELLSRVRARIERASLLKERVEKDPLTGLLSRRSLVQKLESLLSDASRYKYACSVCLIDVDHFKSVNDTYGHEMGDHVLSRLGRLLSRRFRAGDLRGRWGGEEFVLVLPHAGSDTLKTAVGRVLEEFKTDEFEFSGKMLTGVSFSGGTATFPEDGATYKELLVVADANLYRAKHAGRSRISGSEGC